MGLLSFLRTSLFRFTLRSVLRLAALINDVILLRECFSHLFVLFSDRLVDTLGNKVHQKCNANDLFNEAR